MPSQIEQPDLPEIEPAADDFPEGTGFDAHIRGVVVDEAGNGIDGVHVTLLDPIEREFASIDTHDGGKYEFDVMYPGSYTLVFPEAFSGEWEIQSPDHLTCDVQVNHSVNDMDPTVYHHMQETVFHIQGDVYQADETPLAGVTVKLLDATETAVGDSVITLDDGHFAFEVHEAGTYFVQFSATDATGDWHFMRQSEEQVVVDGEHDTESIIAVYEREFQFAGIVRGAALDDRDNLLDGVMVRLLTPYGTIVDMDQTAGEGYALETAEPGQYWVVFDEHDATGKLTRASDTPIALELTNENPVREGVDMQYLSQPEEVPIDGHITGVAIMDTGAPLPCVGVTLLDQDGNPTGQSEITNKNGEYAFDINAAGTYGVRFDDPVDRWQLVSDRIVQVTLTPEAPHQEVNARYQPIVEPFRGRIRGVASKARNSGPLPGVLVILTDAAGVELQRATTNILGSYHFDVDQPGDYEVVFASMDASNTWQLIGQNRWPAPLNPEQTDAEIDSYYRLVEEPVYVVFDPRHIDAINELKDEVQTDTSRIVDAINGLHPQAEVLVSPADLADILTPLLPEVQQRKALMNGIPLNPWVRDYLNLADQTERRLGGWISALKQSGDVSQVTYERLKAQVNTEKEAIQNMIDRLDRRYDDAQAWLLILDPDAPRALLQPGLRRHMFILPFRRGK